MLFNPSIKKETRTNAENRIKVPDDVRDSVAIGPGAVAGRIIDAVAGRRAAAVALDGWYGIAWEETASLLREVAESKGLAVELVHANQLYRPREELVRYKQPFMTDDPGFGYVNDRGRIQDLMNFITGKYPG